MAITKQKKEAIIDKLNKIKKETSTIVFVSFNGLNSEETNKLRDSAFQEKIGYFVAKKTLIKKALNDAFQGEIPELEGEIALAYGGYDNIAAARKIAQFAKEFKNKLTIVGGVFEDEFIAKEQMQEIANIPDLKTLHTQFVRVINAPIQGFVSVLNEIAKK